MGDFVWQNLTHDNILNLVEEVLEEKLSNLLLKRNSYINRVFELEKYDNQERFIVKFYRPNRWSKEMILEEHRFLQELAKEEIKIITPLEVKDQTLFDNEIYFALFPKKSGRAIDEFNKESWQEIGRLLARIHQVGARHKQSQRVIWQPSIATKHHLEVLSQTDYLLPQFEDSFMKTAELFIKKSDPLFNKEEFILLHGDCHKGNLIHRPCEGIFLVDFDDISFGPPVQDLWLLLPDKPDNCKKELEWFLKGYEVFRHFNLESLNLFEVLRGMRIIHFASWLAIQINEPDFKTHFPEAGKTRYWNELTKELQAITYKL